VNINEQAKPANTDARTRDPSQPTTSLDEAQTRPRTPGEARLALLRERGISLSDIARHLGRDLSVVSRVNSGQRRSQVIEEEIARRLELSISDVFPEWHREPT
jgi:hypothetical protein